jgi:hypothetical protein
MLFLGSTLAIEYITTIKALIFRASWFPEATADTNFMTISRAVKESRPNFAAGTLVCATARSA